MHLVKIVRFLHFFDVGILNMPLHDSECLFGFTIFRQIPNFWLKFRLGVLVPDAILDKCGVPIANERASYKDCGLFIFSMQACHVLACVLFTFLFFFRSFFLIGKGKEEKRPQHQGSVVLRHLVKFLNKISLCYANIKFVQLFVMQQHFYLLVFTFYTVNMLINVFMFILLLLFF